MVRTERLAASADRNGMLAETLVARDQVSAADLESYVDMDRIAQILGADDQVEYWKSAAYPLNLMDDYQLKRELTRALADRSREDLTAALMQASPHLLHWQSVQAYAPVDLANARLRALAEKSLDTRNWQLLWLPAALPYYQPGPPFSEVGPEGRTKSLVFSSWRLVPKSIAMLLSYEAERRMLGDTGDDVEYEDLSERRRPLLNFTVSRGRLTGMPVFCLMYPSLTLAQRVDPLGLALEISDGDTPTAEGVFEAAKGQVTEMLAKATRRMSAGAGAERMNAGTGPPYPCLIGRSTRSRSRCGLRSVMRPWHGEASWTGRPRTQATTAPERPGVSGSMLMSSSRHSAVSLIRRWAHSPTIWLTCSLTWHWAALQWPCCALLTRLQRPAPQDNWLPHLCGRRRGCCISHAVQPAGSDSHAPATVERQPILA